MTAVPPRESAAGNSVSQTPQFLPPVAMHLIESRFVRQTFRIQVMRPACTPGEQAELPVVYATDGNFVFDVLKGISYSLQTYARDAPRYILVGIGYPSDSPVAGYSLRGRDMTFAGYPRFSDEPYPMEGVLIPDAGGRRHEGADDFLRFIAEELIPLIDENYPTRRGDRTYFGHSLGGAFGLYTLFTKPELFGRFIVSSPAAIYDGVSSAGIRYQNYDFVLEVARGFIRTGQALAGVKLHLCVGEEEEFEPEYAQWQLVSSFFRLSRLLREARIAGLRVTAEVLAGESHMTSWPLAFMHGIQAVFGTRDRGVKLNDAAASTGE